MNIVNLPIVDLVLIKSEPILDTRGKFSRIFCEKELSNYLNNKQILQINISENINQGTIRGLHFQNHPSQEKKFVKCIKGRVFDVTVDLRKNSPTFLKWYGLEIKETDNNMILIPEGCAHGFQVLEHNSHLLYLHTESYNSEYEDGIKYDDPLISIDWPLELSDISDRDLKHPYLSNNYRGI